MMAMIIWGLHWKGKQCGGYAETKGGIKTNQNAIREDGIRGRCGFLLLEEGCHSAGFDTTIHVRHHLLLSLGWL